MKYLIVILTLISSLACGGEANFKDTVYPLLKKSPKHFILFTNFDFHPTYVHERKDDVSHSISTFVSYSPDDKGSITWSHYVTFYLSTNKDNEVLISSIDFRDSGPNAVCYVPKEVISVDGVGKMTIHKVTIDCQPLLPNAKQLLEQFPQIEKR